MSAFGPRWIRPARQLGGIVHVGRSARGGMGRHYCDAERAFVFRLARHAQIASATLNVIADACSVGQAFRCPLSMKGRFR